MEPSDDQLLFPEFPPVGREEWEALVLKDLKGADFEKKLVWKTGEGFQLQPFYISEDLAGLPWLENAPGRSPYLRGTRQEGNDWEIRQDILVDSPEEANRAALDALSKGAGSIAYIFPEKTTGFRDKEKVTRLLLKEIDFIKNPVHFTACPFAPDLPGMISGIAGERNINARGIKGSAGIDPLGNSALRERLRKSCWKRWRACFRFGKSKCLITGS